MNHLYGSGLVRVASQVGVRPRTLVNGHVPVEQSGLFSHPLLGTIGSVLRRSVGREPEQRDERAIVCHPGSGDQPIDSSARPVAEPSIESVSERARTCSLALQDLHVHAERPPDCGHRAAQLTPGLETRR
jgi:hypothetical protein